MHTITGFAPASRRSSAQWPATAVLPVRLPVPITASFGAGESTARVGAAGSSRRPGASYARPRWRASAARASLPDGVSTGSSARSTTTAAPGASRGSAVCGLHLHRPAVVLLERAARELLLAAAEHHPGQPALGVEAGQRVADGRGVVLAVDQRDGGIAGYASFSPVRGRGARPTQGASDQPCAVSPSSDGPFSYSNVCGSNERIASPSWKGYLRTTRTRSCEASITM